MWWLPLEGAGFEPSVPPISSVVTHGTPARHPRPHFTAGMMMRGTEGSNPPPSSGESVSLPELLSRVENPDFPRGCAPLAWRPGRQRRTMLCPAHHEID